MIGVDAILPRMHSQVRAYPLIERAADANNTAQFCNRVEGCIFRPGHTVGCPVLGRFGAVQPPRTVLVTVICYGVDDCRYVPRGNPGAGQQRAQQRVAGHVEVHFPRFVRNADRKAIAFRQLAREADIARTQARIFGCCRCGQHIVKCKSNADIGQPLRALRFDTVARRLNKHLSRRRQRHRRQRQKRRHPQHDN